VHCQDRGIKAGKELAALDLLPNATEEEKAALAAAELNSNIPEKRALEDAVEPTTKKARNGVAA